MLCDLVISWLQLLGALRRCKTLQKCEQWSTSGAVRSPRITLWHRRSMWKSGVRGGVLIKCPDHLNWLLFRHLLIIKVLESRERGSFPGARSGRAAHWQASSGQVLAHWAQSGIAQRNLGQPPAGKGIRAGCIASQVAGNSRKLGALTPGGANSI